MENRRCIIIGSSPDTDIDVIRSYIGNDDFIACADGGHIYAERLGIVPSLIVGDFDSGSRPGYRNTKIIALPVKKDDTDTVSVINECIKMGFDEFLLFGMTGGRFDLYRTKHGFICGGLTGVSYRDHELKLEKGDKLFLYTDGVPEASDAEHRMFSLERMLDTLNEYKDGSLREILDGVHRNVDRFVGTAPQFDDLTMLCLEYRGKEG